MEPIAAILSLLVPPTSAPVLLDGSCDAGEYAQAEQRDLGHGVTLLAMHDQNFITICASLPPESRGSLDLYLQSSKGGPITNLHISAQVGERVYSEGEDPPWIFGNHQGWFGPPIPFTGAMVRPDGTPRGTFADSRGRELRLSKARFGNGPWRMRLELGQIGPGRTNSVSLPEKAGDWIELRLR